MNLPSNIKDILNIPTGSRNVAVSSISSLTDSQLWPETSQGTSQDLCLSSRNPQQGSQEGSDQTVLSSYLAKPLLFGDLKAKSTNSWILDTFEEDKRKAKEKTDGELLMKECQNIRETLNNIQQLVGTEQNAAVCQNVLEKFDNFTSTLQNNLDRLQSELSQQFDTVMNKVTLQTETIYQILRKNMEGLKEEQEREQRMLEKALEHLSTLVSTNFLRPKTEGVMDSGIQTSPVLLQSLLNIMQESKHEGAQLTPAPQHLIQTRVESSFRYDSSITGTRKATHRYKRRLKKWPLRLSQRSKSTALNKNSQSFMNQNNYHLNSGTSQDSLTPDSLIPLKENRMKKAAGCYITPHFWSQDSNSPIGLQDVTPIVEKLTAECNTGALETPVNVWRLFETNDSDLDP